MRNPLNNMSLNFVGIGEPLKVFEQENGRIRALLQEDNSGRKRSMDYFGKGSTRDRSILRRLLPLSRQEVTEVVLGFWKMEKT